MSRRNLSQIIFTQIHDNLLDCVGGSQVSAQGIEKKGNKGEEQKRMKTTLKMMFEQSRAEILNVDKEQGK